MRNINYWLTPFIKAWELLIDVKLPESLSVTKGNTHEETVLLNFPVVGAFVGFACYLIAWLLNIIPGKPISPYLAAIAITLGLEFITSGRYLSATISFIENKIASRSTIESLALMNDEFNTQRSSNGTLLLVSIFLIRVLCFSFIIQYNHPFWIIIATTLNYGEQAYLANDNDIRTSESFFELGQEFNRNVWIITGAIILILGLFYIPAVSVALALAIFIGSKFKSYCNNKLGGTTSKIIGFSGYVIEIITLLVGLTLLI